MYAACLAKYFGQDFYKMLDDAELLPDDKFFVRYSQDKEVYNTIIDSVGDILQHKSVDKTVKYFKKEFLVDCDLSKEWN